MQIVKSSTNSVKTFTRLLSALSLSTLLLGQAVVAAPFSYEYADTVSFSDVFSVNNGDPVKVIVILDNGGTTRNSQTWTSADLKAVVFNFNNGTAVKTFCAPFDGGLVSSGGNFMSDGTGALTSVMTNWADNSVDTDFTTDMVMPEYGWYLKGVNNVYDESNGSFSVNFTDVGNMLTASNWATSTLTPSCPPPNAPTGLSATVASATQINLAWTDASSNETGFKIFRNGTELTPSPKVGADVATFSDTGLTCNTSYTYTVKATNVGGDSSNITANATTQACSAPVNAPIDLNFSKNPQTFAIEINIK